MRNSIKISAIALSLFLFSSRHSNAQSTNQTYGTGIRLSIGADVGVPVGSLKDSYNWNFGGSVQADFPIINNQLYATINGGYNNFFAKNSSKLDDLHLIPAKAGLKYFPVPYLYVQGEAGATFLTNKQSVNAGKSAVFVYAPQLGVLINTGGKNYIDAGLRFEGNSKFRDDGKTNNFLGIRVAYAFTL
jgi:hypothetical protein